LFEARSTHDNGGVALADVNGVKLDYRRVGEGEPLVLVHGSWIDGRTWNAVVPLLSGSFEVVAYDRRGHSRSSCPDRQGSIHEDVDDLAALIEDLGLAPAHAAGVSLGGSIVLRLAATRSELLRSLSVHEPPLFDVLGADIANVPELAELRSHIDAVAALLEAGEAERATRLYFDEVADTPGGWDGLGRERQEALLANASTYLDQCRDPDALGIELDDLAAYTGPALVTYGNVRPPFFRRMAELVAEALPRAASTAIEGSAHEPQVTHPAEYAETIRSFARRRMARA
jgi:pimeloyl-ACP methyl ester carboxylesterase